MDTPSDHAQADLRVSDVKISADYIEFLNRCQAPLPWSDTSDDVVFVGDIVDAGGHLVCCVGGPHGRAIAAMIVVAVNTCGSFRATRRDTTSSDKTEA